MFIKDVAHFVAKKIENSHPSKHKSPYKKQMNIAQATIGSVIAGRAFGAKNVCGKITQIYPGLGFEVKKDGYKYVVIDDFTTKEFEMRHFVETTPPENLYHALSKETINFWTSGGYKTKERIYGKEIQLRRLIEKDSQEDAPLPFSFSPFISHPPLPVSPQLSAMPTLPTIPQIERVPLDFEDFCVDEEPPNRFQSAVRRLLTEELIEGIEAAHWEMNRAKRNNILWHKDPDVKYHLEWLEAAWDEIDSRR